MQMYIGANRLMGIELKLETEGLQQITDALDILRQLNSRVGAVELHARKRTDSSATNAEILSWLNESGRDFTTNTKAQNEEIAQAFASELERRLGVEFSKKAVIDKWGGRGGNKQLGKTASELSASSLVLACKKWMMQISDRIENEETNVPPLEPLSEDYAERKLNDVGHDKIGRYTGQLLDNLNPDGLGARNIRLKKN